MHGARRHPGVRGRAVPTPLVGLPLGILLALLVALLPPAAAPVAPFLAAIDAPVARAAAGLVVSTDATYVVVPDRAVVRVTVDISVRNDTPDQISGGSVTRYFYDGVNIGVQPDATNLVAVQGGTAVSVSAARRNGYQLVGVVFHRPVYDQESAQVRLTFDLPAGKPRSASDVRVGRAFATFLAWAFGDSGRVRIEIPAGFTVDVTGGPIQRSVDGGMTVLSASTTDPLAWYAWVNASNDSGLTSDRLNIAGGEEIIVRAWPEDGVWSRRVTDLLSRGVPQLVSRIGLPWPVDGALSVIEVHTPLLEGYAGFYDSSSEQITISEDLDNLTIVHEASHAWFNQDLFTERWITEGLADEYASRVLVALGEAAQDPGHVTRTDPSAFPLESWPPPAAIADEQSAAREQYGYDASWLVVRQVVTAVGEAGMRRVFTAASNRTTAYVGAGAPERSSLPNDWRRFLDLTEELGGGSGIASLLQLWALPRGSDAQLQARSAARAAYHALVGASGTWTAPYAVRQPLDAWTFDVASSRIAEADRIIALRDETAALAARQALTPPGSLEPAYEGALDGAGLAAASSLATRLEGSLEEIAHAGGAAAAPRDWLVTLGLLGQDPDADLAAARAAWAAGDTGTATARATLAASVLVAAPEAGRGRATLVGGGFVVALLLLVLAVMLARRRTRRRRLAAAASMIAWPPAPPPQFGPPPPAAPPVVSPGAGSPDAGLPLASPDRPPEIPDRYATLRPSAPAGIDDEPPSIDEEGAEPS